jgi:hypothetical protein
MPGSFADLRRARGAELAQGPFDEYAHSADVRKQRGAMVFTIFRKSVSIFTGCNRDVDALITV